MTTTRPAPAPGEQVPAQRVPAKRNHKSQRRTFGFHFVAAGLSILWLLPIVLVITTSVRSFSDIAGNGLGSLPHSFDLGSFGEAWGVGGGGHAMLNSLIVTIPTVLLSLLLASAAAFALSRFQIPFRRTIILVMLSGNLLPPQILLVPVSKLSELLGIYDTLTALIIVQVGFGLGFYTFVLQGFMRSIPDEIQQAALIDGAGAIAIFWRIILPMTRPALAALGALAFTWTFNDLLWSITVLRTESVMPVTPALLGLQGQYVSNWNVIAAGSVIAAVPTVAVFLRFQKHFISGLAIGAIK
ncbi:carbohydrate ABC transporter permease [Amycolatopsis sp. FDAARGOS 1241]|uniref:carbohydrate ABC transporter permease n=1 Tax=Amycolatopsis sp. FDAARGOS 1241 TaxID=2778070 RepID=UPI0019523692|nr:carbohydrate ABC transporter permease [Amycolatopsis sp. FDAARGOS 1241]QRP46305.1 carbohydrate ABC transporter permease [Amycolatopsis sp. FDAARGOS 1241]